MAGKDGTTTHPLDPLDRLEQEPWSFDFFQVLRQLECLHRDRPRLGRSAKPSDDTLRLGQEPHLVFAPSSIASFRRATGKPSKLLVFFFGLFGPNGPLPLHLTAYARDRIRDAGDKTLSRFADMFHHRMLSFFYRAWADANPAVEFDRPESDRFATYVGSLFGAMGRSRDDVDALPALSRLHYAGLLAGQSRNSDGLQAMLSDYFQTAVEIDEFVGTWMELPESWWCLLGRSSDTGTLGRTLTLGARVWECQNKIRFVLGPLSLDDYKSFLPGSKRLASLAGLVRSYTNDQWEFDVRLALKREHVTGTRLGGDGRLGWTTWLAAAPPDHDPAELVVRPQTTVAGTASREAAA